MEMIGELYNKRDNQAQMSSVRKFWSAISHKDNPTSLNLASQLSSTLLVILGQLVSERVLNPGAGIEYIPHKQSHHPSSTRNKVPTLHLIKFWNVFISFSEKEFVVIEIKTAA